MVVRKCDSCGKELSVWLTVSTKVDAKDPMTNIFNLVSYVGTKDYCPACYITMVEGKNGYDPLRRTLNKNETN